MNFSNIADTENQICHLTHSYEWRLGQRKPMTRTCNKAGTVEDSLMRSTQFKENKEKNKHKELVVVRSGKPIASHFPCTLIQPGEKLVVHYVNSKPAGKVAVTKTITRSSEQTVVFNLQTKGGKNIARIIRNPAIRSYSEITVYGYKGEKVKHALKRDGRFLTSIFKKTCAFSDLTTDVEMSNLVDDLDGKTFQIIMLNKNSPPESQPSSLEDALDTFEHDDANKNGDELHEIPDSREMRSRLSSLVRDFIEKMFTDQKSDKRQLLSVEYGRNQGSVTVETMKKLMILSDSVCQVRIRGSAVGSGFLLFGAFVLTNYHVIKPALLMNWCQLSEPVTVHFSFESLDRAAEGHQVKAVVASEYGSDVGGGA